MKRIMFFIFIFTVNLLFANDLLNDIVNNGNISTLDNLIKPQQLMNFNLEQLRILRETILAKYDDVLNPYKHSYRFPSQHYVSYENIETSLSYVDYENIRLISNLEDNFPVFIPYTDERIYDLALMYSDSRRVVVLGWSEDSKIFYFNRSYLFIYDLKENKLLSHDYECGFPYFNYIGQREVIDGIVEAAMNRYKILPIVDNIHTKIDGYGVYINNIWWDESYKFGIEIGLIDDINNNTVQIKNIYADENSNRSTFANWKYELLTENDMLFACIQNPLDESTIVLIVLIPYWSGGDNDGIYIRPEILGIHKDKLYE